MIRYLSFIATLMIVACSDEPKPAAIPSDQDIARLEKALASHPCVGGIEQWERHYRFHTRRSTFGPAQSLTNFTMLEFELRRTGTSEAQPGFVVHAVNPPHPFPPAGSNERRLTGTFALRGGQLTLKGC